MLRNLKITLLVGLPYGEEILGSVRDRSIHPQSMLLILKKKKKSGTSFHPRISFDWKPLAGSKHRQFFRGEHFMRTQSSYINVEYVVNRKRSMITMYT